MKVFAILSVWFALALSPMAAADDAPSVAAQPATAEAARIVTTIDLLASLVDRGDFAALAGILADDVALDYTSLWGGAPTSLARDEVLAAWSGLLPGFDATRHVFGDYEIQHVADGAVVSGAGIATQWLNGETWTVAGDYVWRLTQDGIDGRVSGIALHLVDEAGSRDLVTQAMERARPANAVGSD